MTLTARRLSFFACFYVSLISVSCMNDPYDPPPTPQELVVIDEVTPLRVRVKGTITVKGKHLDEIRTVYIRYKSGNPKTDYEIASRRFDLETLETMYITVPPLKENNVTLDLYGFAKYDLEIIRP